MGVGNRNTEWPFFELRSMGDDTGREEEREGLSPTPQSLIWQKVAADWRQPFVLFQTSCEKNNSSEARTEQCKQSASKWTGGLMSDAARSSNGLYWEVAHGRGQR